MALCSVEARAADNAFSVYYSFTGGETPQDLILGSDGNLYGSEYTYSYPTYTGSIYTLTTGTPQYSVIHTFTAAEGGGIYNITQAPDGGFYGFQNFRTGTPPANHDFLSYYNTSTGVRQIAEFGIDGRGTSPLGVTVGGNGFLYGTCYNGFRPSTGLAWRVQPSDGSFLKLPAYEPNSPLLLGRDGNFYGTGGNGRFAVYGDVYKLDPSGTVKDLHSFYSKRNHDGGYPQAPLVQDPATGTIYGITKYGGEYPGRNRHFGYGTVYSVTPGGDYMQLFSFKAPTADNFTNKTGFYPDSLVLGSDGNLYGVTQGGGTAGGGVFFSMTIHGGDYQGALRVSGPHGIQLCKAAYPAHPRPGQQDIRAVLLLWQRITVHIRIQHQRAALGGSAYKYEVKRLELFPAS